MFFNKVTRYGVQQQGFTLLEIIVAVGIFGVIASIIYPALQQFLLIRDRVEDKHEQVVALQKTFLFLANDLRYAINRKSKDEYGEISKTTFVLNEENLLEFTAVYPELKFEGLAVPRRVKWAIEEGVLSRMQYPVMDPDADARVFTQSLMKGVREFDIEVSAVEDGRDETDDEWNESSRLPDLVTISLKLDNKLEFQHKFTMQAGRKAESLLAATLQTSAGSATQGSNQNQGSGSDSSSGSVPGAASSDRDSS